MNSFFAVDTKFFVIRPDIGDAKFADYIEMADFYLLDDLLMQLLLQLRTNSSFAVALSVLRKVSLLSIKVKDELTQNIKGDCNVLP